MHNVQAQAFETNNVFIKLTLQAGESTERIFSISTQEDGNLNIEIAGVSGVSLDTNSVFLNKGEAKDLTLRFDTKGLSPAVYVGALKLSNAKDATVTPIILEVESKDILFDSNIDISPNYREIFSDDELIAQFKIFDLTSGGTADGLGPTRVNVEYYIYDLNGRLVSSQSEEVIVDKQIQITKTFSFPPNLAYGDYVLAAKVSYSSYVGLSTALFAVKEPAKKSFFGQFSPDAWSIYLLIIVSFFLILMFFYFVNERNKIIAELRNHHKIEMQQLRSFLHEQERLIRKRHADVKPNIKQIIHRSLRDLSRKHRLRESELKSLKHRGNFAEMRKKVAEWKQKGSSAHVLKYRLNGFGTRKKPSLHRRLKRYNERRKKH